MAATFEQTVAALAENRIASEHDKLGPYRRGFTLLDFDEQEQRAFGVYRFLVGTVPALMPVVYRNGELSGLDILILRDLPLFVPAIDSWISLIASSGAQDLGELVARDTGRRGKGPSGLVIDLRQFPYALKTAEAELDPAEFAALASALCAPPDEPLLRRAMVDDRIEAWADMFPKAGALIAKAAESDPGLAERLDLLHGDGFSAGLRRHALALCPDDSVLLRSSAAEAEPEDDMAEEDAAKLKALADRLRRNEPVQATPEIVDLLQRRKRKALAAFPNMLKDLEAKGRLDPNPVYARNLEYAGKWAMGWRPNRTLSDLDKRMPKKHPHAMVLGAVPGTVAGFLAGQAAHGGKFNAASVGTSAGLGLAGGALGGLSGVLVGKALERRKASSEKLQVVTDIGSPEAAALRPSEKRILLRTGQFIVDHRAEAETALVLRSPASNVFQTCPGAGRWRMLTADGDLAEIETCLKIDDGDDCCAPVASGRDAGRLEVWVVPLDGRAPFTHPADLLHVRQATGEPDARPGAAATREAVERILREQSPGDGSKSDAACENAVEADGTVLFVCKGRAVRLHVRAPKGRGPLFSGSRAIVFTGAPGSIRRLEDKWMIPSSARVLPARQDWLEGLPVPPGDPGDVERLLETKTGAVKLDVRFEDGRAEIGGAVTRHAASDNAATLALALEAGVPAATAAAMVHDAKARPGVRHRYLLRRASFRDQTADDAVGSLIHQQSETTVQRMSPDLLDERGDRVASAVRDAPDDSLDSEMIQQVLSMSDFREITSDSVRRFSAAMDEAGKQLLRMAVHFDRYEEKYGDDAERMESSLRDAFVKTGELALFLREKRGAAGIDDGGASLANLLTDDMG